MLEKRKLGALEVSALGLGCMGMSEFYGLSEDKESLRLIQEALDLGITHLDTSDMYGLGHNERLVGQALKGQRNKVILATKFGIVRDENEIQHRGANGSRAYVKKACEASLKRLGTDYIDLYYLHRLDESTPIEETVSAMAELVQEGKVRHLGLSEVNEDILRRAYAVHPITAVQTEYSLMTRFVEGNNILKTCDALNIGFVAYSPLSRALLSGNLTELSTDDFRKHLPRFSPEAMKNNKELISQIKGIAETYNASIAQISLAWLLAQGKHIVPIPGTRHSEYLKQNVKALEIKLSQEDLQKINEIFDPKKISGARYSEALMQQFNFKE